MADSGPAIGRWLQGVTDALEQGRANVVAWGTSPELYAQLGATLLAVAIAWLGASVLVARVRAWSTAPVTRARMPKLAEFVFKRRGIVFPVLSIFMLGIAATVAMRTFEQNGVVVGAQGLAVVLLLYGVADRFVTSSMIRAIALWIGIPMAVLHVFGWLDDVIGYLDGVDLSVGNIRVSLYALLRTLLFGAILFWLGRLSNDVGKQAIRTRTSLDAATREVFAKLFEIGLYVVLFLLLLQVMGINLTALAVFGGALGVGIGFGLQQIASNFISGIIILLDRSISIGDYIELEDGRVGQLRELNMRFAVLETYEGKDIMVPNERFITTSYTNWTHKDPMQRYSLEFQVAYSTDLDLLFENIRQLCRDHPQVLSGDAYELEFQPDAEIAGFGDSGIDILVEFWMMGIDDGRNRVGADLMHDIWRSIQKHGMEIPFPQREVRILNPQNQPPG